MRSELFGANLEAGTQEQFALQNPRLLRIALDGEVMAGRARWSPTRGS
jgi:hypothetical protein